MESLREWGQFLKNIGFNVGATGDWGSIEKNGIQSLFNL
jgi:hypothetical protein